MTGIMQGFQVRFQHCNSRNDLSGITDANGSQLVCMGMEESRDWINENQPNYDVFFSFNFLDFAKRGGDAYKKGVTTVKMGTFTGQTEKKVAIPLKMHAIKVEDEILNPFP